MDVYIYQADIYCADCGKAIRARVLNAMRNKHIDPVESEDSDCLPQGPYSDGGGEADCPQHCGACGEFLQNPLTGDGYAYVAEQLDEHPGRGSIVVLSQWADYYKYTDDALDAAIEGWRERCAAHIERES